MISDHKFSHRQAPWLFADDVQALLASLNKEGGAARIVGGAVRNTLLGYPVDDIDVATTWHPQDVIRLAEKAGFHTVPTGIDFGTVTVIINHRPFEVTSLRTDLTSNGRHAVVAFGQNWREDAKRRDFTINAIYCDASGSLYDEVGGLEDVKTCRIRFIGAPQARIEEDYLRILRFFRFFAYYGEGRPDRDALRAIVIGRQGLLKLSAERVWGELKKILRAPHPQRALLWMRQSGVLSLIVPESEKWGIDLIHGLLTLEDICHFSADPLLRLMSMIAPEEQRIKDLAHRLKLAKSETKRLMDWARLPPIRLDITDIDLRNILYQAGAGAVADKVKLALAAKFLKTGILLDADKKILQKISEWQRPLFPLKGGDLIMQGWQGGPELGKILARLEAQWIESDFSLTKAQLLARLP